MKSLISIIVLLFTCSVSTGQDFSVIECATKSRPTIPIISFQKEGVPRPVPDLSIQVVDFSHIPSKSKPSWNLLGSMKDAYSKSKMVHHLATHYNHKHNKFSKEDLNRLTINQLWWIHDEDHEGRKVSLTKVKVKVKKSLPKAEPYCPPGSS